MPVWMAWFWAVNLVFFPAWLFGNAAPGDRLRALLLTLAWIITNVLLLQYWIRSGDAGLDEGWREPPLERKHLRYLVPALLVLLGLNIIPATYPLTSSGDEAAHAGTFRGLGRNAAAIFEALSARTSLPLWLLAVLTLLAGVLLLWLIWRICRRSSRHALVLLAVCAAAAVPVTWLAVDMLAAGGSLTPQELSGLVRFPPLSKFLWLPFTLLGWQSVFMLRLPALLCWVLSGYAMYRAAYVIWRNEMALLPALLLLCIPGYFYYGHLVYLTSAMIFLWCVALYFYACYLASDARSYLVLTAVILNAGTLLRVETSYLALALVGHMLLVQLFQRRTLSRMSITDMAITGWLGVSFIPLWSQINPSHRPFVMMWHNLTTPRVLLAIADDYPLHIGLPATLALLACIVYAMWRMRKRSNLSDITLLCLLMVGVSYVLYTLDYMTVDNRMVGLFAFGREWQTAHRFLVSWSPFVVLFLTDGVAHLPWRRLRLPAGLLLAGVLLAQATFWAEPLTVPEFTSIRLRPGVEYPHLPEREVLAYVSQELATPQTRILLSPHLAAGYFLDEERYPGQWLPVYWDDYDNQTLDGLVQYCDDNDIDLVVLPLVWMNMPGSRIEVGQAAMADPHFEVQRVFDYQGEPGILVARFIPAP